MAVLAELKKENGVGVLRIDNPPVNALSPALVRDLTTAFDAFDSDTGLTALVIECAGSTFVAGGDIAAFDDPGFSAAPLNALLARIEASARPVVAALHGTVLGGGVEVAIACHHRVATPDARFGMPEITLGLLPGSLGTQRLPRLIGIAAAAEMIVSGKPVNATRARALGLVDTIDADPFATARRLALTVPVRRASEQTVPDRDRAGEVLDGLEKGAAAKPWLPALARIADCLRAAVEEPFEKGEEVEKEAFAALVPSVSARALRHVFFAERAARRIPGLGKATATRNIAKVGVVGVGTMGAGISMTFANAGYPVTMVETTPEALARGQGIIAKTYDTAVSRGRMDAKAAEERQARLTGTTDLAALADVDLVVEAVFEDMALKLDVAEKLGAVCRPGAIIATNTSTLDVDRIAAASGRAGDVLGTHFFSPAHIMRLLEVVRGEKTDPEVLNTLMSVARRIGKTAVVSGVCYGFIGNRMAEVYGRENEAMQLEGATPQQIDGVAENPDWIGMAMGPSRMLDMAGVDVGARTVIEWIASGEGPQEPEYRAMCRALYEAGRHGQKTGEGYYRYEGRTALPSDARDALAADLAKTHGIAQRDTIPEQEIFERLLYPMINEAAAILSEGIAYRPSDIDVVWTAGYGFPAWRGGPLFTADEIGLSEVVARMDHYAATLGNEHGHWTVTPLLRDLAKHGKRLTDWQPEEGEQDA